MQQTEEIIYNQIQTDQHLFGSDFDGKTKTLDQVEDEKLQMLGETNENTAEYKEEPSTLLPVNLEVNTAIYHKIKNETYLKKQVLYQ